MYSVLILCLKAVNWAIEIVKYRIETGSRCDTMVIQANIKIDSRSYPKEAQKLLKLRSDRQLNKMFLLFLRQELIREKQTDLFIDS